MPCPRGRPRPLMNRAGKANALVVKSTVTVVSLPASPTKLGARAVLSFVRRSHLVVLGIVHRRKGGGIKGR